MFGANDPEVKRLLDEVKDLRKQRAKQGVSEDRKRRLRARLCGTLRRIGSKRREAENAAMAQLESEITPQGQSGPIATDGRREWAVRNALKRAGHKQQPRRLPNRIVDPSVRAEKQ